MSGRTCTKREVTREELDKFVREHQPALTFDGMRYTHRVQQGKVQWNKPVAFVDADGGCWIIEDL